MVQLKRSRKVSECIKKYEYSIIHVFAYLQHVFIIIYLWHVFIIYT